LETDDSNLMLIDGGSNKANSKHSVWISKTVLQNMVSSKSVVNTELT